MKRKFSIAVLERAARMTLARNAKYMQKWLEWSQINAD